MSRRRARGVPRNPRASLPNEVQQGSDFLLAFFDTMEQQRRAGEVLAWRVQRGPETVPAGEEPVYCVLQVLTPEAALEGRGRTWLEAHRSLVDAMIARASRGAPKA